VLATLTEAKRLDAEPAQAIAALIAPVAAAPAPEQVAVAKAPAAAPLPRLPSQRALDAAFAAHLAELKPCVEAELQQNPKLLQVRIAFIAEGDGSAHGFHVAPASSALAECLYPKVAGIRLPAFSERRSVEQVTISLRAASEPVAGAKVNAPNAAEPWWAWRAQATRLKTQATPWWHIEQPLPPRLDESSGSALEIEAGAQPVLGASPPPAPPPADPAPVSAPAPAASPAPAAEEPTDSWWVPKAE
jgi:hypothetical protein